MTYWKCPQEHCDRLLRHAPTGTVLGLDDPSCTCPPRPDIEIVRQRGEGR